MVCNSAASFAYVSAPKHLDNEIALLLRVTLCERVTLGGSVPTSIFGAFDACLASSDTPPLRFGGRSSLKRLRLCGSATLSTAFGSPISRYYWTPLGVDAGSLNSQ